MDESEKELCALAQAVKNTYDKSVDLEKENAALKRQLADYEHETYTVKEIKEDRDQWKQRHGIQEQAFITTMQKLAEREKDLLAVECNYNIPQETIEKLKEEISHLKNKVGLGI